MHFLGPRHCFECFLCINSVTLIQSHGWMLISAAICRWGNYGPGGIVHLLKVTTVTC